MKRGMAFLMAFVLMLGLCACGRSAEAQWQEQYDLGVRYLSEGNYEEAIIAFTAAIEIDPNRAEAYVGRGEAYISSGETEENLTAALADYEAAVALDETLVNGWLGLAGVYISQGDYDKALEVLQNGLESTNGSPTIEERIKEMEGRNLNLLEAGVTKNMLRFEEIQFLGRSVEGLDIETMKSLMVQNGFELSEQDGEDHWWVSGSKYDHGLGPDISAMQYTNEPYVCLWGYESIFDDKEQLKIGIRNIYTYDTIENVLTNLGFSNATDITSYINKIVSQQFDTFEELQAQFDYLSLSPYLGSEDNTMRCSIHCDSASILDNGTNKVNSVTISFSFVDHENYSFSFRFSPSTSLNFVDCLVDYSVSYMG